MTTKVDASSSAEAQNVQFTDLIPVPSVVSVPKVSMFAAKAGFVIPKNKLSGSLVPILRGGGKTVEDDVNEQVRRKTKWGPDLTVDPAVRKGRALAYRTRLEQITQQLKSRGLDMKDNLGSQSPSKDLNNDSASQSSNNEITNLELLELERREIIGEIMCLHPSYKAPSDYTPLLKEAKIPIPPKVHPGRNFIALLLGPASNTQRRLEEETGAKVRVYGTKKETGKEHEITQSAINEADESYEELYVTVSAETYEKVDAAVALIELLLAPVSQGNIAVLASSSRASDSVTMNGPNLNVMGLSYTMMPMPDVNRGSTQTLLATAVPGQTEYQSYAASWYPNAQPSAGLNSSAPSNSVTFSTPPFSGTSVSPYGGPPFGINLGNSPVTFRPPVPMQSMQQPVPQFVPSDNQPGQQHPPLYPVMPPQPSSAMPPHTSQLTFSGKIASGSTGPPNLQLTSGSPTSPSPNRPLSMQPLGSPGWSTSSRVVTSSQRSTPPFAASTMRPSIPVPPSAISSIPSPNIAPRPRPAMLSQPNNLVNISSKPPPANFSAPPQFPSQPGAKFSASPQFPSQPCPNFSASPQFPSQPGANFSASPQFPSQPGVSPPFGLMPQRGPVSASAGAPFAMPRPASSLLPSSMVVPRPPLVPAPPFLTPGAPVTPQTYPQAPASFNPVIPIMGQPPASPLPLAQASTPAQIQVPLPEPPTSVPSIGGIHGFSLAQERTNMNNTPIKGPRPPLPISSDFTFQPLGVQVSHSGNSSMPNSQSAKQLPTSMAAPQPPSFRPCIRGQGLPVGNHGFASPQVSNPAPLPSATLSSNPPCIEPPLSHHFSYANTIRPLSLSSPIGPPSFSSASQISNLPAARPHFLQPNQNQLLPAMRVNTPRNSSQNFGVSTPFLNDRVPRSPGVSQIYDPFSPTSASSTARKQEDNTSKARTKETDAEYEDLMASVGVK